MTKGLFAVLVVFFGFWLFTDPHGLASFAGWSADEVSAHGADLFGQVTTYLGDL